MPLAKVQRKRQVTLPTPRRARLKRGLTADDEYTPAQRRVIDARLAKALAEVKEGRTYGPFNTVEEMAASLGANVKKPRGKTKRSA